MILWARYAKHVPSRLRWLVHAWSFVIGVSVLSGAHVALVTELMPELREHGVGVPVVLGGTVPASDVPLLESLGVQRVYPVGSRLPEVVEGVIEIASNRERVG